MTSWRQFQANRLNALKSTGPRTEEGKRTSRRNALRHGLTADTVIDPRGGKKDFLKNNPTHSRDAPFQPIGFVIEFAYRNSAKFRWERPGFGAAT
jgi:hypothetical protein